MWSLEILVGVGLAHGLICFSNISETMNLILQVVDEKHFERALWYNFILDNYTDFDWLL